MQFSLVSVLALAASATAVSVSFDNVYDSSSTPLANTQCSDGANGLITRYGWTTLGQVPKFPNVGGAGPVQSWNSANCGKCYKLTYGSQSVNVLAVDGTTDGSFNIAQAAMNTLTNGQAAQLGRVEAGVEEVAAGECGL
ncbi:snodprot1 [Pseudovirgaria hyperparasitica]|uniref:Snodprot1 n=1 Tax=Pseudovirgaria hyperparasitica TaxID=470096 RepID=A0A6A6WMA7_9PEZI|nr:snodprot1 [Pseudovirgaria hyperparasitica]KAF2763357.1 snodprot1 [Pseudovirgaria hyperparasitica]